MMDVEKTPVAILHELMSKIKATPHYELCPNELNTIPPIFTFKVVCDSITASGSGRSKRDAKQNAANAMLEKLKTNSLMPIATSNNKSRQSLSENIYMDNIVQDLQRLCMKYKLVDPIYKDLDSTGPPHARLYNIQCIVSTLETAGIGKSKKQAKYEASYDMIYQIKSIYGDNISIEGNNKMKKSNGDTESDGMSLQVSTGNVNSMLEKMKIYYDYKLDGKTVELMENFEVLAQLLPSKLSNIIDTIKECQHNLNEDNIIRVKQEFQSLLESANIDFHHMLLQTSEPETYMLIVQLNTTPDIIEMSLGSTREEAELLTINKVIAAIRVFLKIK